MNDLNASRVRWSQGEHRTLFLADAAEVRVWELDDGRWLFKSDSGRVNFIADDLDSVDTTLFWK